MVNSVCPTNGRQRSCFVTYLKRSFLLLSFDADSGAELPYCTFKTHLDTCWLNRNNIQFNSLLKLFKAVGMVAQNTHMQPIQKQ